MVDDPAEVDPSGELAVDVAMVPDGAASEEVLRYLMVHLKEWKLSRKV